MLVKALWQSPGMKIAPSLAILGILGLIPAGYLLAELLGSTKIIGVVDPSNWKWRVSRAELIHALLILVSGYSVICLAWIASGVGLVFGKTWAWILALSLCLSVVFCATFLAVVHNLGISYWILILMMSTWIYFLTRPVLMDFCLRARGNPQPPVSFVVSLAGVFVFIFWLGWRLAVSLV